MKNDELKEIQGGAITKFAILGGIIVFLIGIIDGYVNPTKCNN